MLSSLFISPLRLCAIRDSFLLEFLTVDTDHYVSLSTIAFHFSFFFSPFVPLQYKDFETKTTFFIYLHICIYFIFSLNVCRRGMYKEEEYLRGKHALKGKGQGWYV